MEEHTARSVVHATASDRTRARIEAHADRLRARISRPVADAA
ncbi:hypothetical protein OG204_20165 [Streptomyces sp. NBC_01387]